MKRKYITIPLLMIGVALLCWSVTLAITATSKMNIIGGADLPTFLFQFPRWKRGLYYFLASLGVTAIASSVIMGSKSKWLKNTAILPAPLLLLTSLRYPFILIHVNYIIEWLDSESHFSANHFTRLFWIFVAICTTVLSFFVSKRILKNKKWLRIIYVVGMFVVSNWISYIFYLRLVVN